MNKSLGILYIIMLVLSIIAIPAAYATISVSPGGGLRIFYGNTTADTVYAPAGDSVNIKLEGVSISGTAIWLVISPSPSNDVIYPDIDAVIVGLFFVSHVTDTTNHTYEFYSNKVVIDGVEYTLGKVFPPFTEEERVYTFVVGNNWINGTMPFMVEGGKQYWLKITDIDPGTAEGGYIPPSDVAVSINSIVFTPAFDAFAENGDNTVVPNEPLYVRGYALPLDLEVNITQNGELMKAFVTASKKTSDGWNWTGFEVTFPALDLVLRSPDTADTITIEVINATDNNGTVLYPEDFTQEARAVWLARYADEYPLGLTLVDHNGDYSSGPGNITLYTGLEYNITLYNFPFKGSVTLKIENATYEITRTIEPSPISLDEEGSVVNATITIPIDLKSGKYVIRIFDNNDVEYNFTVNVVVIPVILADPDSGQVGSQFVLYGYNFYDYVGDYVTIWFEVNDYGVYVMLKNFTVPGATWSVILTVPEAAGGDRVIEAREADGTTFIASTIFTVLPKLEVVPSEFPLDGREVLVLGTGFMAGEPYFVDIDNKYLGVGDELTLVYPNENGTVKITFIAAGFAPGLHVVALYPVDYDGEYEPAHYAFFNVTGVTPDTEVIMSKLEEIQTTLADVNNALLVIQGNIAYLVTEVGDIKLGISDLKAMITQLGDDIELKLDNVNESIVSIVVKKGDEIITELGTKLSDLEAMITEVKDGVAEVKTILGDVKLSLSELKNGQAEIKDLIITKSGDVVAVVKTAKGDILAKLDTIEDLIKSGVKADTEALLAKVDEIKSALGGLGGISDKLDALAATLDDIKGKVAGIDDVKSIVTDIKTMVSDLSGKVSGLEGTIKSTGDDVKAAVKDEVAGIKDAVSGIGSNVTLFGAANLILLLIALGLLGYAEFLRKKE